MYSRRCVARPLSIAGAHAFVRPALSLLVLIGWLPTCAWTQTYRTDEVTESARLLQSPAERYAQNPAANAADRGSFVEYFTKYYFPSLTRTDAASLADLSRYIDSRFKRVLLNANDQLVQTELTGMAYNALAPVVASRPDQPPYHPSVRYNAVLILGMLDEVYANQAGGPKPLPAGTNALSSIVGSATTATPFPPAVILGALIGMERHARYTQSMSPAAIDAMTAATLKLVTHDDPIEQLDGEEYDWLRLRAASALAQLGNVGTDNANFNAVLQLVGKLKLLDDRCDASALLAKFKYEGASLDGAATAQVLLKLSADVADAELAKAIEFESGSSSGASISNSRGRGGDFGIAESSTSGAYPRRPLLAHLITLRQALTGTKPALPPETQAKFDAIVAAVTPVIDAASNKDTIELAVASRVREMSAAIKRVTAAAAPAPAAAPVDEILAPGGN